MRDYHSQLTTQNKTVLKAQQPKRGISWTPSYSHPPGIANSHPRQPSHLSAGQINLHLHLAPETNNLLTGPGNGGKYKNTLVFSFPKKETQTSHTEAVIRGISNLEGFADRLFSYTTNPNVYFATN
jgi:hypothetical protein